MIHSAKKRFAMRLEMDAGQGCDSIDLQTSVAGTIVEYGGAFADRPWEAFFALLFRVELSPCAMGRRGGALCHKLLVEIVCNKRVTSGHIRGLVRTLRPWITHGVPWSCS